MDKYYQCVATRAFFCARPSPSDSISSIFRICWPPDATELEREHRTLRDLIDVMHNMDTRSLCQDVSDVDTRLKSRFYDYARNSIALGSITRTEARF